MPQRNRVIYHQALLRASLIFTYTPKEKALYSKAFNVPLAKFVLVRLHASSVDPSLKQPDANRFDIIMAGATARDWGTFSRVCEAMPDLRFAAIAPVGQVESIRALPNLTKFPAVEFSEYCHLLKSAKVMLLLVHDRFGAVGQRDMLVAGQLGCAVIATDTESLRLYCRNHRAAIFVREGDTEETCTTIGELLADSRLRSELGRSLKHIVSEEHTPEAVGEEWAKHLAEVLEMPQ
jgi:hypothetical protein